MTNLEKRIMASRGYVHPFDRSTNFSVQATINKPDKPAPEGYEYVRRPYGKRGDYRWYLVELDPKKKIKENAPKVLSALVKTGTEPGTTSKVLGDITSTIIDTVSGNA